MAASFANLAGIRDDFEAHRDFADSHNRGNDYIYCGVAGRRYQHRRAAATAF
jgi:hypothetical protein